MRNPAKVILFFAIASCLSTKIFAADTTTAPFTGQTTAPTKSLSGNTVNTASAQQTSANKAPTFDAGPLSKPMVSTAPAVSAPVAPVIIPKQGDWERIPAQVGDNFKEPKMPPYPQKPEFKNDPKKIVLRPLPENEKPANKKDDLNGDWNRKPSDLAEGFKPLPYPDKTKPDKRELSPAEMQKAIKEALGRVDKAIKQMEEIRKNR